MNNIFSGLNLGLKALETQRKSLDVTGHNIANANNEDYNKQRAVHQASTPYTAPSLNNSNSAGQMGTGVEIKEIERVKDQFISSQIFKENQSSAYWDEMSRGLEKIEYIFNEPSDSGIDTAMNQFWNSLQDLSNNPADNAARNMVRENAYTLIDTFQSVDQQLLDYKESINTNLSNLVTDINQLSTKIADLNKQIVSVKGSGQSPNDLLDERDALYKEMNQMINVQGRKDAQGNLIVSTEGLQLVNGADSYNLEINNSEPGSYADTLVHSRTGTELEPTNGKAAGWLEIRDQKLDFYRDKLDSLAAGIVKEFNSRHQNGYDAGGEQGENFFEEIADDREQSAALLLKVSNQISKAGGLKNIAAGNYSSNPSILKIEKTNDAAAGTFRVDIIEEGDQFKLSIYSADDDAVIDQLSIDQEEKIAFDIDNGEFITDLNDPELDFTLNPAESGSVNIGMNNYAGSGDNAQFMADIFDKSDVLEGTSVEGYFRTIITSAGAESKRAEEMKSNQDVVLKQLKTLDRSVSGVSLDEEMAKLIKYQQAYSAAAKYINKTEELLDSLMTIV